jgi:hypothetical protein
MQLAGSSVSHSPRPLDCCHEKSADVAERSFRIPVNAEECCRRVTRHSATFVDLTAVLPQILLFWDVTRCRARSPDVSNNLQSSSSAYVISGFCRGVNEIFALLGYYTA